MTQDINSPLDASAFVKRAYAQMDYAKYFFLLRSLLADMTGFFVLDDEGALLWQDAVRFDQAATPKALSELTPQWLASDQPVVLRQEAAQNNVYMKALMDMDRVLGRFVLVMPKSDNKSSQFALANESIQQVQHLLLQDLQSQAEIERLGGIVDRQRKELSLIFDTQEDVRYYDEGRNALKKLVKNMVRYMDVDFAGLVFRAHDIELVHQATDSTLDAYFIINQIAEDCRTTLEYRGKGLFFNNDEQDNIPGVSSKLACRFIASPIFDQEHKSIGFLIAASSLEKKEFRKTDDQLVKIMARKASRIIQPNYDSLTGLITRNGFEYYLETALCMVRYYKANHCVMNIDLDKLHVINETASHHAGDEVLRQVAKIIKREIKGAGVAARIGGDEFGVLLNNCNLAEAKTIADNIVKSVSESDFYWDKRPFGISVSIGLAEMTPASEGIVAVMGSAEVACIAAKEFGRNRAQLYEPSDEAMMRRQAEVQWVGQLNHALRENRFELFAQEILPINQSGEDASRRKHFEVLLRLHDENNHLLSPTEFLPSAEKFNLMSIIDRWVFRQALKTLVSTLPERLYECYVWTINLSGQTLGESDVLEFIIDEVQKIGFPPVSLCFEVTETAAISDMHKAVRFMEVLKKQGFQFALDDFGTGLSSFAYLRDLPVDYLKIDGSFIGQMAYDEVIHSMVASIHRIAEEMGLQTIAEYVNDQPTLKALHKLGVHFAQGHEIHVAEPFLNVLQRLVVADAPHLHDQST